MKLRQNKIVTRIPESKVAGQRGLREIFIFMDISSDVINITPTTPFYTQKESF